MPGTFRRASSGFLARAVLAIAVTAVGACGGGSRTPTSPEGPPTSADVRVVASDRLGWTQSAPDQGELASYEYAAYVDGQRTPLRGASCKAATDTTADCSAPLPTLNVGRHVLELVAATRSGSLVLESPRAPPLAVVLGAADTAEAGR